MKTLLVSGSPAANSHTHALLVCIAKALEANGHTYEIWDLGEKPLPLSQPSWHVNPLNADVQAVCDFYGAVQGADAVVLGTPNYHGSYSGVIKNALDCLTGDAFANKPVGVVSHGSNLRKSHQPCLHLTTVVMTMKGTPMLTQIGTAKTDYENTAEVLRLTDHECVERCNKLANELVLWVERMDEKAS